MRYKDNLWIEELSLGGSGPRVAIKDCLDIAGSITVCGSRAFADASPAQTHAAVVDNILSAGCRIVGRVTMHELAYGVTGINDWAGTAVNPRWPDHVPGGSSSGSAVAVAADLVDFSVGTDTGGSIRVPAACCGIVGLKPSFGRISRKGASPATSSLDCIGPFASSVEGIERAMQAMDPQFLPAKGVEGAMLGLVAVDADATIMHTLETALERSGFPVTPVVLPSFVDAFHAGMTIIAAEMAPLFSHLCGTGMLGADVDARLAAATRVTATDVAEAERVRHRFTAEVDEALAKVDALVLPTMPAVPPRLDEAGDAPRTLRMTALVRPFNLSGHPAMSLPLQTAEGLPAGLQMVGRHGGDAVLCALAKRMEAAL